jgi:serine/threonine-protein kinase
MSSDGMNPDPGASASGPMQVDALQPGELFDRRYRIVRKLGEGGMGEVYAAEHVTLQKKVAIKLLRPEIVSNQEAVKRFRQEATSSSSIGHPNIIRIEDFADLPDGRIYLCMEHLEGAPLNDLVKANSLSIDRLLNVLIQTGHGLSAAHAKGIVHRDMKPENIFVTRINNEDVPKILDFGIAKVAGNDGQNNLTRTGTIFGTPFYMAPEQALGQAVDGRVDIYAMGVICYEVFAGSLPFRGESFMGILTQHITTEPEPVAQRAAAAGRGLPPGLAEIISRALVKDPDKRFQTMDEMVQALVTIYRQVAGAGMSSYMEAYQPPKSAMMAAGMPSTGMHHAASGPGPAQMPTMGVSGPHMGQQTPYPQGQPMHQPPGHSSPSAPYGSAPYAAADSSMLMATPKKSKVGLIFALIAVLAVVGGGIAVFVVMSNKSGDSSAESDGEGDGTGTGTAAEGSGTGTGSAIAEGSGSGTAEGSGTGTGTGTGSEAGSGTGVGTGEGTGTGSQAAVVIPDAGVPEVAVVVDAAVAQVTPPDAGVVKVEPITVLVDANASGAAIYENGKKIDKAPAMIKVTPGEKRTLVLKKKGYKDTTVVIDGGTNKVKVSLDKVGGGGGGTGPGTGVGTSHGTGTGTSKPPPEDPRKKLCREHPDDPRCMLEP